MGLKHKLDRWQRGVFSKLAGKPAKSPTSAATPNAASRTPTPLPKSESNYPELLTPESPPPSPLPPIMAVLSM